MERGLVREFVEKTLAGSLTPFMAYLADARGISDDELAGLRQLVEELEAERHPENAKEAEE